MHESLVLPVSIDKMDILSSDAENFSRTEIIVSISLEGVIRESLECSVLSSESFISSTSPISVESNLLLTFILNEIVYLLA